MFICKAFPGQAVGRNSAFKKPLHRTCVRAKKAPDEKKDAKNEINCCGIRDKRWGI